MEGGRQAEIAKAILSAKNVPYVVAAPLLIQVQCPPTPPRPPLAHPWHLALCLRGVMCPASQSEPAEACDQLDACCAAANRCAYSPERTSRSARPFPPPGLHAVGGSCPQGAGKTCPAYQGKSRRSAALSEVELRWCRSMHGARQACDAARQDMGSWMRDGVAGLQSVVLYSLPELDGAIDSVPLGGLVGNDIYLVPERAGRLAARLRKWVHLRRTPPQARASPSPRPSSGCARRAPGQGGQADVGCCCWQQRGRVPAGERMPTSADMLRDCCIMACSLRDGCSVVHRGVGTAWKQTVARWGCPKRQRCGCAGPQDSSAPVRLPAGRRRDRHGRAAERAALAGCAAGRHEGVPCSSEHLSSMPHPPKCQPHERRARAAVQSMTRR